MPRLPQGLVRGDDGLARCWWGASTPDYAAYHDEEWGRPVRDDVRLFEKICLEGFQAGLSWLTILTEARKFPKGVRGFRLPQSRSLQSAQRGASRRGPGHRPASREDRIDDQQRQTGNRARGGVRIPFGVLLGVSAARAGAPAEDDQERVDEALQDTDVRGPQQGAQSSAAGLSSAQRRSMPSCRRWVW